MQTNLLGRRVVAFALGALLGSLAMHFVLLATKGQQGGDRFHGDQVGWTITILSPKLPTLPTVASTIQALPTKQGDAKLCRKVRLLCLIMTHPTNYATKAVAVNNTWADRCDKYIFVGSNGTDLNLPLMRLNLTDNYNSLWQKTWMSLDAAEKNFNLDDFDFVLKADDDTFVVVENLRLLLAPLDPLEPAHLGRTFYYDRDPKQRYMSGGAGYILSRAAVRLFVQRAVRAAVTPRACDLQMHTSEDWMMGTCLTSLGVKLVNSRDSGGLDRFHPVNVEYMIGWGPAEMPPWMWTVNYYKFKACLRMCISSVTASFHYTNNMYLMEFLLYGLRPVGVDPAEGEVRATLKTLQKRIR